MMNDLPDPIRLLQHYIGGRPRAPQLGRYFARANSEIAAARIPRACAEDVDLAIEAAKTALRDWRGQGLFQRRLWLRHVAAELRRERFQLVEAESRELGLNTEQARDVVLRLVDEQCRRPARDGIALRCGERELRAIGEAQPHVARLLLPESAGLALVAERLMPLLAAGCPVVACVLHREDRRASPRLLRFLHTVANALPDGALNVVSGVALEAGQALANAAHVADFILLPKTGARRCQCGQCTPPRLN